MGRPGRAHLAFAACDYVQAIRDLPLVDYLRTGRGMPAPDSACEAANVAVGKGEEDRDALEQRQPCLQLGRADFNLMRVLLGGGHRLASDPAARKLRTSRVSASGIQGLAMKPAQPAARAARS